MRTGHIAICVSATKKCYAFMWSYGEICVHCNCCGVMQKGLPMWIARARYHIHEIAEACEKAIRQPEWYLDRTKAVYFHPNLRHTIREYRYTLQKVGEWEARRS